MQMHDKFLALLYTIVGGALLFIAISPWIGTILSGLAGFLLLRRGLSMLGYHQQIWVARNWFRDQTRYYR